MLRRFGAWMRRHWHVLAAVVMVAGLLILLIARGDFQGIGIAYWQSHAQQCGTLQVVEGNVSSGNPQSAATCFMQAYSHCRAAELVESSASLDTPPTYTYLVEPQLLANGGHACSIQANEAIGGSDVALASNHVWVSCADVAQRWYGLRFYSCGTYGDLFVSVAPLSQAPPGMACGDIHVQVRQLNPTLVDNAARDVVTCFLQAQQTCQPAWAATTVTYPVAQDSTVQPGLTQQTQMLLVEPYHTTCAVLELEWRTYDTGPLYIPPSVCTDLVLNQHGLYVDNCERGVVQIVLPICGGQPPEALNTPCAPVPQARN